MKDKKSAIFGVLPIISIILIIRAMRIYQKTFIPLFVVIGIGILAGVLTTLLLRKTLQVYFPASGLLLQFIYNTIVWGGYIMFFFLWINCRFTDIAEKKVEQKIISTGHLRGRRGSSPQPYIIVYFDGKDKQIVYDADTPVHFEHAELTIAKGFFGYDVVQKSYLY